MVIFFSHQLLAQKWVPPSWQPPNYIPEKRKFLGILCFRQQRSRRRRVGSAAASQFRCQCDNF